LRNTAFSNAGVIVYVSSDNVITVFCLYTFSYIYTAYIYLYLG